MADLYERLARRALRRADGQDYNTGMAAEPQRELGLPPVPGLLADEIAQLLARREDRGQHDGFRAGYESGSHDSRAQAEHMERNHIEVVLEMLGVELLEGVAAPLAMAAEMLGKAEEARASARTPKERATVKEAVAQARERMERAEERLAALLDEQIPAFTRRVLEDGLPL